MIQALITNRNRPNVIMVIGNVRIIKIGFKIAFRIASTIARTSAVKKVSMWMPRRIYDNPNATTADTIMRTTILINRGFWRIRIIVSTAISVHSKSSVSQFTNLYTTTNSKKSSGNKYLFARACNSSGVIVLIVFIPR